MQKLRGEGWIARAAMSHLWGIVFTFAVVVSGLLASLYAKEIREAQYFLWNEEYWYAPIAFWSTATISCLAIVYRQSVFDSRRQSTEAAIQGALDRIPELLTTLPPAEFLHELGLFVEKSENLVHIDTKERAKGRCPEMPAQNEIARKILRFVCLAAKNFDECREGSRYCASLMVLMDVPEARTKLGEFFNPIFVNDKQSLDGAPSCLTVTRELSATDATTTPDEALVQFVLPMPSKHRLGKSKRWHVLPGAPFAAAIRETTVFTDTDKIGDWMRESGDFSPSIVDEVTSYFKDHREDIAGFISTPVFLPSTDYKASSDRHVCAILNIHWSLGKRLKIDASADLFAKSIYPLRELLGRLLVNGSTPSPDA